jgi:glycosyltransferase involved in cell wall biosynthesis
MHASHDFLPGPGEPGLVSVIIPTFNRAHLIAETLDSLLAQTFENFEAIVVDDGSRDDTRAVMARYADRRVQYFHKENGGLSSARNFGLARARGEFIAFLDSDDLWLPWKLAVQAEVFRRLPDVGMICSDMSTFETSGTVRDVRHLRAYYAAHRRVDITRICAHRGTLGDLAPNIPEPLRTAAFYEGDIFRQMYIGNLVHPPTAIVRRSRLQRTGGFEPAVTGGGAEDYHFYFKITEQGPIAFIDAPTILYRVHQSQMSTTGRLLESRADLRVINHWLAQNPGALPRGDRRTRLAASHGSVGSQELYAGNHRAAIPHLWRSLRYRPNQPFGAILLAVSLLPRGAVPAIRRIKRAILRRKLSA